MNQNTSDLGLGEEVAFVVALITSAFADKILSPFVGIAFAVGLAAEIRHLARTRSIEHARTIAAVSGVFALFALWALVTDVTFEIGPSFYFDRSSHLALIGATSGFFVAACVYLLLSMWSAGSRHTR